MTRRNWNHEASVAAKWWIDQVSDGREEGMARIFGLILGEMYAQEANPEIEQPSLRIALRIDAPSTPTRKMTMHIAADSVKVYSGFASEGPQVELIAKLDSEVQS
jgi:hypothetical protein